MSNSGLHPADPIEGMEPPTIEGMEPPTIEGMEPPTIEGMEPPTIEGMEPPTDIARVLSSCRLVPTTIPATNRQPTRQPSRNHPGNHPLSQSLQSFFVPSDFFVVGQVSRLGSVRTFSPYASTPHGLFLFS